MVIDVFTHLTIQIQSISFGMWKDTLRCHMCGKEIRLKAGIFDKKTQIFFGSYLQIMILQPFVRQPKHISIKVGFFV